VLWSCGVGRAEARGRDGSATDGGSHNQFDFETTDEKIIEKITQHAHVEHAH
jgi:hypothetical protein